MNLDSVPTLLRNDGGSEGNWISVALRDRGANRRVVGATVGLSAGSMPTQQRSIRSGTGYLSQDDTRLHFGLGGERLVTQLEVRWPDGSRTRYRDLRANVFAQIDHYGGARVGAAP